MIYRWPLQRDDCHALERLCGQQQECMHCTKHSVLWRRSQDSSFHTGDWSNVSIWSESWVTSNDQHQDLPRCWIRERRLAKDPQIRSVRVFLNYVRQFNKRISIVDTLLSAQRGDCCSSKTFPKVMICMSFHALRRSAPTHPNKEAMCKGWRLCREWWPYCLRKWSRKGLFVFFGLFWTNPDTASSKQQCGRASNWCRYFVHTEQQSLLIWWR